MLTAQIMIVVLFISCPYMPMSGGSPLHLQMEPILVAGEWLYSQLLVLLGHPHGL
jgi:hypothetical protein